MVEPPFDAYHKWLGIPPKDQPPDHYRLLGIERFEPDPEVISHAADARMAHVKMMATGAHGQLSQDLLNAISAARVCLLNAQAKATYDAKLQEQHGVQTPREEPRLSAAGLRGTAWLERLSGPTAVIAALGLAASVLLLAIAFLLLRGRTAPPHNAAEPQVARSAAPARSDGEFEARPQIVDAPPLAADSSAARAERRAARAALKAAANAKQTAGATAPASPAAKTTAQPAPPPARPTPVAAAKAPPPSASAKRNVGHAAPKNPPGAQARATTEPAAETAAEPKKSPVPSEDQQSAAQKEIRELYKPQQADTPQAKADLAEKLFLAGVEMKDDPVSRYVLLHTGWLLAGEAGKLDVAFGMIDRAESWYELDPLDARIEALERLEKATGTGPESEEFNELIVEKGLVLVDEALRNDDHETALRLMEKTVSPAAHKTTDKQLAGDLAERRNQIKRQREEFAQAEKARAALAGSPADAEANLVLGRWYCFYKRDWDQGLPYLARSSEKPLADLARRDLAGAASPQAKAELGDAWWEQGQRADARQKDLAAARFRGRAAHWYRQAVADLTGLTREKVQQRLAEASAAGDTHAQYALELDGLKSHVVTDFGYSGSTPITIEAIARPGQNANPTALLGNYDRSASSGLMLGCQSGLWTACFCELEPRETGRLRRMVPVPTRLHARPKPAETDWRHVALVYDGKQLRLYVGGQLQDSRDVAGSHNPTTRYPFVIGAAPSRLGPSGLLLESYFKGLVKAVRISSVARYSDNFEPPAELRRQDGNTQLLLQFNKGKGDLVEDTSGRRTTASASRSSRRRTTPAAAKIVDGRWIDLATLDAATDGGKAVPAKTAPPPGQP
jgi:hypothetical protein